MSWTFVRFHEIWFQTEPESFSFLSWKTKKDLFLKKLFLSRTAKIDPKDGISRLNFPEGFDFPLAIFPADVIYECPTLGLVFPAHLGPTMSFFRC